MKGTEKGSPAFILTLGSLVCLAKVILGELFCSCGTGTCTLSR
jgi:hypothetical protein